MADDYIEGRMYQVLAQFFGGVGLFLLGMTLMTNGLKDATGETLKNFLTQFTATPLKAMFSGIGLTLLVQSSTATTMATIGFVNAGMMSFAQAIGVVIGANIGTTSTGWMVALLGLKFSISMIALPLIGLGAMLNLIGKERIAIFGLIVAGFGLIFFGISILQEAMAGFSAQSNLSFVRVEGFWAQILLVVIGLLMALLLQSSSAAITATLAALASGAIDLPQALFMVIGQNVGAVGITIISVIGASVNAKRTVAVNVVFNLITAILAFFVLAPVFIYTYEQIAFFARWDALVVLALFHTIFSVMGALVFMPATKLLEKCLITLLPDDRPSILKCLDEASLDIPAIAIQSARKVQYYILFEIFSMLNRVFQEGSVPSLRNMKNLDAVIFQLELYLEKIIIPDHQENNHDFVAVLRVMVYVRVLRSDLENIDYAILLRTQPAVLQTALDYTYILESYIQQLEQFGHLENIQQLRSELNHLKQWSSQHRTEIRQKILQHTKVNQLNAAKGIELLAAQRWMERLIAHTYRFSNVLYENILKY